MSRFSQFFLINLKTIFFVLSAAMLLAACSLAGDVTPPPGFEDTGLSDAGPSAAPVFDLGPGYPASMPSAAEGATLYSQNCTRCHGLTGGGDGELVSQIQFPVPAFNVPDLARATTPFRWYSVITNGNLERVMPPWGGSLSESQRWSLVAYLYSLSGQADAELGQAVYEANCADCHGDSGAGDGPGQRASGNISSFSDQVFMAAKSNNDFFLALTDGINGEHKFADSLSEDERWAAADYARAFSYDFAEVAAAPASTGTVTGTISNGTTGANTPADQAVVLHLFDSFQETSTITTTVQSDGAFEFADVELAPDRALIVSARYGDVLYTSDVAQVKAGQTVYDLPVQVFESTTDSSVLSVERMHVIFDFKEDKVQIGELFIINNNGDKTLAPVSEDGPTFSAALPAGFAELSFQDDVIGGRYQQTADGFADTLPVRPGAGAQQILVSFSLPYADALSFAQKISYPTSAVSVLLPDNGVTLTGAGLRDEGLRDVQGANYHSFTVEAMAAGDNIAFSLEGKPSLAATTSGGSTSASTVAPAFDVRTVLIGGLSLALSVAVIAYWWIQRGGSNVKPTQAAPPSGQTYDELLDELAELDDGFEAGEYSEAEHHAKREKLKAELKRLVEKEKK
ncbi:MAG: cytochrome c [Chloroflexi bacterium]|nr:cytochrome c [Chloroflexota bacterium]